MRAGAAYGSLSVLAAALLWATTGTAAAAAPEVGSLAIGAAAMGVGGLLQAATALGVLRTHLRGLAARWPTVALAAAATAAYPLAFYSSMRLAGVAVGTVVSIGSAPAVAAVVERFADGQRLSRRWALGAALGAGGVLALAVARGGHQDAGAGAAAPHPILGVLLGLAAGATYAVYSWGAARLMRREIPTRPAMGAIFGLGGVLLLPVLLLTGGPIVASGHNLAVATYLAVVPMFLGYLLFGRGLASVSASTATSLSLLEPAAASLIAVTVLHERLPAVGWAGIALLAVSLALAVEAPRPATSPRRTPRALGRVPARG